MDVNPKMFFENSNQFKPNFGLIKEGQMPKPERKPRRKFEKKNEEKVETAVSGGGGGPGTGGNVISIEEMHPEPTEADLEIQRAQDNNAEAATQTKTEPEGSKPNGHDRGTVDLKGKPPMLSDAAEIERKKSLDEAHKVSYNEGLRMVVAIGYPAIMAAFADRPTGSMTPEELIEYRDSRLAELPEKRNYHRFSWEANSYINNLFPRTQNIVKEFFKGRYNVQLTEVKAKVVEIEKPRQLSMEAELERRTDIENAFKKSDNEGRRMKIAVSFRAINEVFVNNEADSVVSELYRKFRDSQLANLPADANYHKFSKEAFDFLSSQKQYLQDKLNEMFAGELDVQLTEVQDELMLLNAETAIRYDHRKDLKIDEDALVVKCATDHDEPMRFVAMVWRENSRETGNFFRTKVGEVKSSCDECREIGVANGVEYSSYSVAIRKINSVKFASATFADAVKKRQEEYDGDRRQFKQFKEITEEEKRAASKDVKALLNGGNGPFFIKHPTWEVKVDGKVVQRGTWTYIIGDGDNNITIMGAGKGFGNLIGKPQILRQLPPHLFRFLDEVRNLSRKD